MPSVSGNFTAVANSVFAEGLYADLVVGGVFVGNVQLQAAIPGAGGADVWVPVGNQLFAPGIITVPAMAIGRKFRAACSAYTSGTIYYSLGTSTVDYQIY